METDIRVFEVVDSTNVTLAEMAENGAGEGTCVIAFMQRAGQGRSGRTFYSPEGANLYMSLLLRPAGRPYDMITVMAAVAVVHAIKRRFGIDTGIKWVNDIIYSDRKVCGIVAKAHDFGGDDPYVVLGIGVNIYESSDVPPEIADTYGSLIKGSCELSREEGRRQAKELASDIIEEFSYYYEDYRKREAVEEYRKHSVVIGRTIEYVSGNDRIRAVVAGIDDDAAIVLDIDGKRQSFRDGEIRIRIT